MKVGDKIKRVRDGHENCPLGYVTEALKVDAHAVKYRRVDGTTGITLIRDFVVVVDGDPVTVETREVYTINNGTYGRLRIERGTVDQVAVAFTSRAGEREGMWFFLTADELDEAAANMSAVAKALRNV